MKEDNNRKIDENLNKNISNYLIWAIFALSVLYILYFLYSLVHRFHLISTNIYNIFS